MKDKNKENNGKKIWNLRVTSHLNHLLEEYIEKSAFSTKSEFIRESVRDRLIIEQSRLKEQEKT